MRIVSTHQTNHLIVEIYDSGRVLVKSKKMKVQVAISALIGGGIRVTGEGLEGQKPVISRGPKESLLVRGRT